MKTAGGRLHEHVLPAADDARRLVVREWLAAHPQPSAGELAAAGYVAPHWPRPWGLGAGPIEQLIIDDELARARIRRPGNLVGLGWAGPTIIHAGTDAQKQRYLPPILEGREVWCQLFSEPEAGSDLANVRTRAVRDGDDYVVNGQKIWSSYAQHAQFGILLARTNPDVPKQHGISYLICPMDAVGIEIRPIIEMTGTHTFNEVFFTDVRIPTANLVGRENDGWSLAKVTLGNERVSISAGGVLWGTGPTAQRLVDLVRDRGGVAEPPLRQRIAQMYIEAEILELIRMRTLLAQVHGRAPGPEASIRKLLADEHGQQVMRLAKDLAGADGMLADRGPFGEPDWRWHHGFLFAPRSASVVAPRRCSATSWPSRRSAFRATSTRHSDGPH